jgi:tetratricopeptide (TPR) repeat protein
VKSPLPLLFLIGLLTVAPFARADDDQLCRVRAEKYLASAVKACTAILRRPLLTPQWKFRALMVRGYLYQHHHQFDLAITDFSSAISVDSEDRLARGARAETYSIMGEFHKAQQDLEVLLKKHPNNPLALNDSCWIHAALWELEAAMADCRRSLAIAPKATETLDSLGFVQFRSRKYKEALAAYDAALAITPNHATSLYVRGVIKRKLGNIVGGDADIRAAGKIAPEVAESFARFGLTQGN